MGDDEKEPIECTNKEAKQATEPLLRYFEQLNLTDEIENLIKIKTKLESLSISDSKTNNN